MYKQFFLSKYINLVGCTLVVGLLFFYMLTLITTSIPSIATDFFTLTLSVVFEAIPFVIIGVFLSSLVTVFLQKKSVLSYLPKQGFLRRLGVSFGGTILPVCECGNVPIARSLIAKGASVSDATTFLLAAPIISPITIFATTQAFRGNSTILFGRILGGVIIANLVGWLLSRHKNQQKLLTTEFAKSCDTHPTTHSKNKLYTFFEAFESELLTIVPSLLFGAGLAALIQISIPREWILSIGSEPVWGIVAMIILAFVVSICASVDAFFALAFAASFSTGAIVAFLVFGPMIDIKLLSIMRTTYKASTLAYITTGVFLGSLLLGMIIDYVF